MPLPATVVTVSFYLAFPALVLYAGSKNRYLRAVNPVIVCYLVGIGFGNIGVLPEGVAGLQDSLSSVVVALSIPLLLFSVDIRSWTRTSVRALTSMGLAAAAVAVAATVGHVIFAPSIPQSGRLAGMMVGLYTGGTPNLAAIATALDVPSEPYLAVHATDTVLGGLYLLFVITVAKPLLGRFLPAFQSEGGQADAMSPPLRGVPELDELGAASQTGSTVGYAQIFTRRHRKRSLLAFGAAALVVGASLGISMLVPPEWETVVVLLSLTTLALLASLVPAVNRIPTSFKMAEYLVLVFCLVVGSMANLEHLLATPLALLGFVTFTLGVSLALHLVLAWVTRIDVDTMIITSTAAVCSPPFVGMVGVAIRNRTIISAGIVVGIIGYAVGNYLGIFVALVLERLL